MPSTRSKLVLDEESFQGLLAAAFTIQQYNDKQGGIEAALSAELVGTLKTDGASGKNATGPNGANGNAASGDLAGADGPDRSGENINAISRGILPAMAEEVCRQCGAPLLGAEIPCLACNAEVLRPGERLQRTWATMWSLSQEQGTFGPGSSTEQNGAWPGLAATNLFDPTGGGATLRENPGHQDQETAIPPVPADRLLAAAEAGDAEAINPALDPALSIALPSGALASDSVAPTRKARLHRADLYLALSVLVASVALLWPTASAGRSQLRPWERMLIAIGIAEAPSEAEVHNNGDPNIKVWVDTQAALYYCPGDDLYGKSPGGHYTTQHEAQADRFEPALRRACVP